MSIDYNAIKTKFVSVIQAGVGTQLSSTGPTSNPEPSVIKTRPVDGAVPDYPYIVIDVLDTRDEQGWLSWIRVNQNNNPVYGTYKTMLLSFRCYGEQSLKIMNDLRNYFLLEYVRDNIRDTLGGSVVEVLELDSMPIKTSDRFLESAAVNLIFNIKDETTDTSSGIIDNINLDGEIYRHNDDPDPFTTTIIEP